MIRAVHLLLLVGLAAPAAASAGTLESGKLGDWFTAALSDDAGRFLHCGVLSGEPFKLSIGITMQRNAWALGIEDERWSLQAGTRYEARLAVDGKRPIALAGEAFGPHQVNLQLPPSAALFDQIKSGKLLHVDLPIGLRSLPLQGSAAALPQMVACVKRHDPQAFAGAASANPFRRAAAEKPAGQGRTEPGIAPSIVAEASIVLANLFSIAGITGFTIIPPDETPVPNGFPFWSVGPVNGMISVVTDKLPSSAATAATLSALSAFSCRGKYASTRLDPDSTFIVHMASACETDGQLRRTFHIAFKRRDGGYYTLSTIADPMSIPEAEAIDARFAEAVMEEARRLTEDAR